MRKISMLCICLLLGGACMAQEQEVKDSIRIEKGVFIAKNDTADIKAPMFTGGEQALLRYICNNLRYPEWAQNYGEQGRVLCIFTVNTDGTISNVRVLQSVSYSCDQEAIRVLTNMPKWIPGQKNGVITKMEYVIPIIFKLQ